MTMNAGTHQPANHQHDEEGQPVCLRCFTPFHPLQDYCENCGEAVGQLTPYKPFVNIRFNYSIFGRMWKIVWRDAEASLVLKSFCFVLIVLFAPIMLVGLPFILWEKSRRKAN